MLASLSLIVLLTGTDRAAADPAVTRRMFQVEHVRIDSTKTFADVAAALESAVPELDPAHQDGSGRGQ